jgi:hypothetical protein
MSTVLFGAAVPLNVGVASLVTLFATGAVMIGAAGGCVVPTVNAVALEAGPVLPAASVAVAVAECVPAVSGVDDVQLHVPAAFATAVHVAAVPPSAVVLPSSTTVMVAPGSAVPEKIGFASVVAFAAGVTITGAAGGVVSTVNGTASDGALVPVVVVAVATT